MKLRHRRKIDSQKAFARWVSGRHNWDNAPYYITYGKMSFIEPLCPTGSDIEKALIAELRRFCE